MLAITVFAMAVQREYVRFRTSDGNDEILSFSFIRSMDIDCDGLVLRIVTNANHVLLYALNCDHGCPVECGRHNLWPVLNAFEEWTHRLPTPMVVVAGHPHATGNPTTGAAPSPLTQEDFVADTDTESDGEQDSTRAAGTAEVTGA